jgi:hypothetical protein
MATRIADLGRRGAPRLALPALAALAVAACGPDWDLLDPSLGGASEASSQGAGAGGKGGGTPGSPGAGGHAPAGAGGHMASGAGGAPQQKTVQYFADVAACIDPMLPEPEACEVANGEDAMNIDENDTASAHPYHAFVSFELDEAFAGRTVQQVTLRLVVASYAKSAGDQSGEIWEVEPFDELDLDDHAPEKVGTAPLAQSGGPVTQGQVVEWALPVDLVAPEKDIYLGIFPVSDDGVDYWNDDGAVPPELVITYQ